MGRSELSFEISITHVVRNAQYGMMARMIDTWPVWGIICYSHSPLKRVPPLGQPESTGNRIQRNRNLPDDKPAPVSKAAKRLAKKMKKAKAKP